VINYVKKQTHPEQYRGSVVNLKGIYSGMAKWNSGTGKNLINAVNFNILCGFIFRYQK
jgi:hypothetical protein